MEYEQKYNEALKSMRDLYNKMKHSSSRYAVATTVTLEKAFPELKEPEDERIRKFLIDYINARRWYDEFPYTQEQVISWLKKQGEKKEIDYGEELKKCKENPLYFFDKYVKIKLKEQKSTWSEEDERICQCLIKDQDESLEEVKNNKVGHSEIISDLKDMYRERIDWLKSLKGRVQPKQEWSEEDEQRLQDVIYWFEIFCDKNKTKPEMKESLDWLKSIKPNHWKPSEEQMKHLKSISVGWHPSLDDCRILSSLYNDLLKLFES